MMTLFLPPPITERIRAALHKAGIREIGGVLMAEHVGPNEFEVQDVTIHKKGAFASFIRKLEEAIAHIADFFRNTNQEYTRFNYVGEWHSHPSFEPVPSPTDDISMREIVSDEEVGANFVVLLVLKLNPGGQLFGSVHTYLPDGTKHHSALVLNTAAPRR